jgi:tetratricopeptide (TPR) repeat protein
MIAIAQRLLRSSGDPHYLFLAVCCLLASSDDADGSAAIVAEELILSFAGTLDVGLDAQQRVLLAESIFRQEGRLRDALTVLDVGLKALSLQSEPDDDRGILLRAYERMLAGDAAPLTDRDLEIVEELLEQTFEWAVHARVVTRVNDYAARYLAFLRRLSSERDGDPGPRLAELALMESMCARRGPDSDGDLLALQQLRRFLDDFADTFNGRANSLGPELRRVVVALFRRRPGDVVDALVRALERCRQAALCAVNLSYLLSCCEFDSTHVFRGKLAPASVVLAYRASEQALRGPLLAHTALLLLAELRQDPSASVAQSIDAVALCLSVISEYPDSASALMLSVIPHLRRLGAASVAVPFVPQLLEAPEKILIAHSLGLLLLDAGMEDEALDLFQFVIDVHDKAEREALIAFGALLDSGSFVAALWAYRQAERTAGSLYRLSAEYEVVQLGADSDDKALAEIMERVGTAAGRSGVEGTYDLVSYEVLGQFETSVDAESAFRTKLIERRVNFLHGLLSCLRHLRDKDLKAALESLGAAEQLGAVSQSDEGCASRRCIIAVARLCCGSGSPADCDDALADLRLTLLDPSSLYLAPFLANVCTWAPVFVGAASRDVVIYSVALKLRDLQGESHDAYLLYTQLVSSAHSTQPL